MVEPRSADVAPFRVVGVGASAGGITALQALFATIPADCNLAFVIVQHLMTDHPSQLARLFSTWTPMPACEALEGSVLKPGHVYVSPPGVLLELRDGAFTHRAIPQPGTRAGIETIDTFFESLADEIGERAVGVVLSGTGADGAAGAVRIKQAGGMVLVQDPNTAMYDGMPSAAIANGAADHVLPLGALALELVACASPSYARSPSSDAWADEVTVALEKMIALIRDKAGFDLAGYKTTPLLWRIQRRMQVRRVPLFRDYEALLHDDPSELEELDPRNSDPRHRVLSRSIRVGRARDRAGSRAVRDAAQHARARLDRRVLDGRRGVLAGDAALRAPRG